MRLRPIRISIPWLRAKAETQGRRELEDSEYQDYLELIRIIGTEPMPYDKYKATLGWRE